MKKASSIHCIGMSVTNNIKSDIIFDNETGWDEIKIDNDTILEKLQKEEKEGFLSFSYRSLDMRMGEKQSFGKSNKVR